ncbi:MAG: hypothetical protein LQ345_006385 [Seirophora villosa]|nr:MAG: hypothetical protein LQ345_006385 [Seirophora villosa]
MFGTGSKTRTRVSNVGPQSRPQGKGEQEKNLWSSLLNGVASGKKLPEKNLLVLGGNAELQREFLETLESDSSRRPQDRRRRKPPVANEFALGYTYQDVLDADHDALVKPLLTAKTIPETLVVILLDWADPWSWARQLRDWVRFLRGIVAAMDDDCKVTAEETMKEWQQRRRGAPYEGGSAAPSDTLINIPLGQGEWDEPLGLPICVACHGTEKIETLERDHGWREEEFDFSLQYLRTILLKHGSSLIYTSLSVPNSLPTLIHSSLGIHSLLKRQTLKHNVIDRDKVLVPPNWDSWGKIRVLREGFDVEGISSGWSIDIQAPATPPPSEPSKDDDTDSLSPPPTQHPLHRIPSPEIPGSVLFVYEDNIPNPYKDRPSTFPPIGEVPLSTTAPAMQDFLKTVQEQMQKLAEAEASSTTSSQSPTTTTAPNTSTPTRPVPESTNPRVNEHIGPVQFNMGGIQVDADEMLRKLQERGEGARKKTEYGPGTPEGTKKQNEELAQFFAGLMEKGRGRGGGGGGSPRVVRDGSAAGRSGATGGGS